MEKVYAVMICTQNSKNNGKILRIYKNIEDATEFRNQRAAKFQELIFYVEGHVLK